MSMEPYFRPPGRELRWIAAFAFAVLVSTAASAQNVSTIRVSKDKAYTQTAAGAAQPWTAPSPCNFGCPLRFAAYVYGGDMGLLAAPVLSGPVNTGAIGSAWNGGRMSLASPSEWRVGNGNWDYSATQAGLDAVFPSGTYTINVGGKDVALNLAGDAYPNPPVSDADGRRLDRRGVRHQPVAATLASPPTRSRPTGPIGTTRSTCTSAGAD